MQRLLDSRRFERPFVSGGSRHAHLRPRRHRAPSCPACSRSRRSPAASSTTPSCRPGRRTSRDFPDWLDPRIVAGLAGRGISRPYTHQAEAIEAVHAGSDVVVVTPTASGKSLCYSLPILQAIAEDPAARALLLFPTKALGQDQVAEFGELAAASRLHDLGRRPTTATRRRRSARRSGPPARSSSPTRTCSTRRSSPITPSGSSCSSSSGSSSSTSCTPIAACSAATSRTSSAGCSGSAPTTAASRSSSAARRRSGTRPSSRRC